MFFYILSFHRLEITKILLSIAIIRKNKIKKIKKDCPYFGQIRLLDIIYAMIRDSPTDKLPENTGYKLLDKAD